MIVKKLYKQEIAANCEKHIRARDTFTCRFFDQNVFMEMTNPLKPHTQRHARTVLT